MTSATTDGPAGFQRGTAYLAARRTALVAAVFSAVVFVLLIGNMIAARSADPIQSTRITTLQIELNRAPTDDRLRRELRTLDVGIRREYFRSRSFALTGLFLLLGGLVVFLTSLEVARRSELVLPMPNADASREAWMSAAQSRRSVIAIGGLLAGLLLTLVVLSRHDAAAEYVREAARTGRLPAFSAPQQANSRTAVAPLSPAMGVTAPGLSGVQPTQPAGGTLVAPPVGGAGTPGGTLLTPVPTNDAGSGASKPAPVRPPITPTTSVGTPHPSVASVPIGASAGPFIPAGWAKQWPGFRGPAESGLAGVTSAPTSWNAPAGQGLLWKVAVPLPGWNSPVVWGDRVFLSGADKKAREVYCYDLIKGALLWRKPVPTPPGQPEVKVSEDTGLAPSTLVTDGKYVCAMFVNGDLACFDVSGKQKWVRRFGVPDNNYGHASSLALYGNGVIVQLDQGSDARDGKSALYAVNIATGQIVWRTPRPVPACWATPIVVRAGARDLIVCSGNPYVIAYDARTGTEVWRAECLNGEIAPSPTVGGGFVLATMQGSNLAAIRPNGAGDVTKTGVAWKYQDNLPDIVSPAANADFVFLLTSNGLLTCLEAKTGAKVWEHDFETAFHSSPVIVSSHVYVTDSTGLTHVLEAGRAYKEAGKGTIGEEVRTTPAFVEGKIVIRGKTKLYCIGAKR